MSSTHVNHKLGQQMIVLLNIITQKLEFGLRNVQRIQEILEIAIESESELQPEVVTKYLELTTNLKSCILTLLSYWDVYLEKRNTHTQYQTIQWHAKPTIF